MSYIYTVKPLKEAVEIAIQHKHLRVEEDGDILIYGIQRENWPSGVNVKSTERVTDRSIYNVGTYDFAIPVIYFTETEEKEEVPEFIVNLYNAMTAACGGVKCEDCPLHLPTQNAGFDCCYMTDWTRKRWFSK